MSEPTTTAPAVTGPAPALAGPRNPFERAQSEHLNAGAVAIESERAVAEAQGKLVIAKRFPRDPFTAYERIIEACKRPGLAGAAFYSFKRGDGTVSGPSIRLAEELARCWGNLDYGLRELSNRDGVSEMEAYAWDMETNTVSSQRFTVRHLRDTTYGAKELTAQRDIYEIGANMGARRLRARILSLIPDDLVEAATKQCRATLAGQGGGTMADKIKGMVSAFAGRGVSVAMLEGYMGHRLDMTTPDELAELLGVFQALKDGQAKVSDYFGAKVPEPTPAGGPAPAPEPKKRGRPAKAAAPSPEPEPKPEAYAPEQPTPAGDDGTPGNPEPAPALAKPGELF